MKALVISRLGDPEVLEVRSVPDPVPTSGQELIEVEAGGINFADIMSAQGGYPGTPKPPLVAGREFCGTRMSDGQRVMGYTQWAAFAERVAAPSQLLWPVPAGWSAEEGAAFPVNYFTAYFAYWKAGSAGVACAVSLRREFLFMPWPAEWERPRCRLESCSASRCTGPLLRKKNWRE